eukprot:gene8731-10332_t
MPSLAARFEVEQQRCLADPRTPAETWEALVQQIDRYKLPRRHMLMKPILDVQLSALTILAHYKKVKNQTRRVALQRIELMQNIFPYPHREVVNAICEVCALCGCASPAGKAALTLHEEKALLQKALRMHLILNGRENRLITIIGFELPYEIVENRARGKFVIAKRDILPGELVLEEKEPLMYFTDESVDQRRAQSPSDIAYFCAACSTFKKLPASRKRLIENLYGPTDKPFSDGMRALARNLRYVIPGTTEPQAFDSNDVDIFVKVSALMQYNSFFSKALVTQITDKLEGYQEDKTTPVESWEFLLQEIERYKLPRRHMKVRPILEAKLTVLDKLHRYDGVKLTERKRRAALECIEVVQNVFPHPRSDLVQVIRNVCNLCGLRSLKPVLSLEEEKALRQKVVRMQLIMHGRENRDGADDNALAKFQSSNALFDHNYSYRSNCQLRSTLRDS